MFPRVARSSAALLIALALLSNCRGKTPDPQQGSATAPSASAETAQAGASSFYDELESLAQTCELSGDRARCPGAMNWKLIGQFLDGKRDRVASLPGFAQALGSSDARLRTLAASILWSAFRDSWGSLQVGAVPREAAAKLLSAALGAPELAKQALPAAVHAMMLSEQSAQLFAELAKPEHGALRSFAYPYLMTYGRLSAFGQVRELFESADPAAAGALLDAPTAMQNWTTEEQSSICGWAEPLLAKRADERAKLELLIAHCSGAPLDRLLARSEKSIAQGKLDDGTLAAFGVMCSPMRRTPAGRATEQQCSRVRSLLTSATESKLVDGAKRAQALLWISEFWPDAVTAKLLTRLEKDSHQEVAKGAREAATALEAKLKSPGAQAQAESASGGG